MRILLALLLTLVCISAESVLMMYLHIPLARVDVTVVIVAFLALRTDLLEGAVSSYVVGFCVDLLAGRPTGLYTFLAVLTFLLGRLANSVLEVRSRSSFVAFCMMADLGHGLLALLLDLGVSKNGTVAYLSLTGLPLSVLLTGGAALLLYPVLRRMSDQSSRGEPSLLRR